VTRRGFATLGLPAGRTSQIDATLNMLFVALVDRHPVGGSTGVGQAFSGAGRFRRGDTDDWPEVCAEVVAQLGVLSSLAP